MTVRAGRRAGILVVLGAVAFACVGSARASTLVVQPKKLAVGRGAVSSCGPLSGASLAWTVTAGNVTAVTLSGLPAACVGGRATVALRGAANVKLAEVGPVLLSGTSQRLSPLSPVPSASLVLSGSLAVTGP